MMTATVAVWLLSDRAPIHSYGLYIVASTAVSSLAYTCIWLLSERDSSLVNTDNDD